ncbi:hypothetical protein RYX36_016150 [Vicia faba]
MCPLRVILIFLSATLAGFFVLRNLRSQPKIDDEDEDAILPSNPKILDSSNAASNGNSKVNPFHPFASILIKRMFGMRWNLGFGPLLIWLAGVIFGGMWFLLLQSAPADDVLLVIAKLHIGHGGRVNFSRIESGFYAGIMKENWWIKGLIDVLMCLLYFIVGSFIILNWIMVGNQGKVYLFPNTHYINIQNPDIGLGTTKTVLKLKMKKKLIFYQASDCINFPRWPEISENVLIATRHIRVFAVWWRSIIWDGMSNVIELTLIYTI